MNTDNRSLEEIRRLDYRLLGKRLLAHALYECSRYSWRGAGQAGRFMDADLSHLAKGMSAADLVEQALELTLDGRRPWDQAKFPDITAHLKWVIRSLVSNLATSSDNARLSGLPENEDGTEAELPAPEELDEGAAGELRERLRSAAQDDPLLVKVIALLGEEKRPEEIAAALNLTRRDIYRLTRKLRRRLTAAAEAYQEKEAL